MKPPVDAPASRQRAPATATPKWSRAPISLCAPREAHCRSSDSCTVTGVSRSTTVAGFPARTPRTATRPCSISSAACCRERASPRRTSSASRRARVTTAVTTGRTPRSWHRRRARARVRRAPARRRRHARRVAGPRGRPARRARLPPSPRARGGGSRGSAGRGGPDGTVISCPRHPCRTCRADREHAGPTPHRRRRRAPGAVRRRCPSGGRTTRAVRRADPRSRRGRDRRRHPRRSSQVRSPPPACPGRGRTLRDPRRRSPAGPRAGAASSSVASETPVSTSSVAMPAARPPWMSVSSRSPTTSGAVAPTRRAAVCISAGAGLPATWGSSRVAVRRTATSAPLPGTGPRSLGRVGSTLHATQTAPARSATQASASVA